jgi:hypothetical protein
MVLTSVTRYGLVVEVMILGKQPAEKDLIAVHKLCRSGGSVAKPSRYAPFLLSKRSWKSFQFVVASHKNS